MWKVRFALGWLACAGLACSSDDPERERVDLSQAGDPSTAAPPRTDASGPRGTIVAEGVGAGGGTLPTNDAATPDAPTPGVNPPNALADGGTAPNLPGLLGDGGLPAPLPPGVFPDAGAPTGDAGVGLYTCSASTDCVVRNVGNCCGYYPRCVNANATITPPDCSGGQGSVCGFPVIDSCECRANRCISLQGGVER
jgi:hypothetical protein